MVTRIQSFRESLNKNRKSRNPLSPIQSFWGLTGLSGGSCRKSEERPSRSPGTSSSPSLASFRQLQALGIDREPPRNSGRELASREPPHLPLARPVDNVPGTPDCESLTCSGLHRTLHVSKTTSNSRFQNAITSRISCVNPKRL